MYGQGPRVPSVHAYGQGPRVPSVHAYGQGPRVPSISLTWPAVPCVLSSISSPPCMHAKIHIIQTGGYNNVIRSIIRTFM